MIFDLNQYIVDEEFNREVPRAEFANRIRVGDMVKIRQWNDMFDEYGPDDYGGIACELSFIPSMKSLCGKSIKVTNSDMRESVIAMVDDRYNISRDMIEPVDS